jgi:hypothetical protein
MCRRAGRIDSVVRGSFLAVILAVLVAGCGATNEGEPEARPADLRGFGQTPRDDEEELLRREIARENWIARCMHEKGFEYVPEPAVIVDDDATVEELWNAPDPNGDYRDSLSPERLRAYSMALAGVPDLFDEGAWSEEGCLAEASRAVPPR